MLKSGMWDSDIDSCSESQSQHEDSDSDHSEYGNDAEKFQNRAQGRHDHDDDYNDDEHFTDDDDMTMDEEENIQDIDPSLHFHSHIGEVTRNTDGTVGGVEPSWRKSVENSRTDLDQRVAIQDGDHQQDDHGSEQEHQLHQKSEPWDDALPEVTVELKDPVESCFDELLYWNYDAILQNICHLNILTPPVLEICLLFEESTSLDLGLRGKAQEKARAILLEAMRLNPSLVESLSGPPTSTAGATAKAADAAEAQEAGIISHTYARS
ncbi:hypothetical protein BGZ54_003945 [Gamsiella multidivaricata]|nr:hypothetical protein BGZ54_003945 [Gamsiella multidivaricata]